MLNVLWCLAPIFIILVLSEYLSQKSILKKEYLRKFVHVLTGVYIAFWPWLLTWQEIQLISLAFLVVVFASRQFNIFGALRSVKRTTYGDIFFALGVGVSASITTNEVVFCIAILLMAVADGVAAIVGNKYGGAWGYKVVKQHKTLIGSMAFWAVCLLVLGVGLLFNHQTLSYSEYITALLIIPPVLTLLENVMPYGSDNLAIPLATIGMLAII